MSQRVAVIGAGASGIAAIKVLREHGLEVDGYEAGSQIGGVWCYENDNQMSAAYRSLHINTSKKTMAFSDFPMPESYPDYPHHEQIRAYFEAYAERFDVRRQIRFRRRVVRLAPEGGGWRLEAEGQGPERYRAVLVCNGHHWSKRWASFPGTFSGETLHAHDYRVPEPYVGKRVLVIGIGNSAVDIACELSRVCRETWLSTRRSAHILPKYIFGRPTDHVISPVASFLPLGLSRFLAQALLAVTTGDQERYGVPRPAHELFQEHPTMSPELLVRVGHGDLRIKPNIERFDGPRVRFVDGSQVEVDVVIYATGYDIVFPFLDDALVPVRDNRVELFLNVVPPELAGLFFIGLVQPLGPIMPLSEAQCEWVADVLSGECRLPSPAAMRRRIARTEREMRERYVESSRHTIQVDFYPYLFALRREQLAGRARTLVGSLIGRGDA